ncbi:hypothetical protein LY78DRAFT_379929 [Colletotrichum sublineola]|nr:hypothetical protein LY78DRAFT_379929 [Colletotrichum sublineola]
MREATARWKTRSVVRAKGFRHCRLSQERGAQQVRFQLGNCSYFFLALLVPVTKSDCADNRKTEGAKERKKKKSANSGRSRKDGRPGRG